MLILGIETSCDETSAAVVADGREVLSNVISSQTDLHATYGGVVPEIASRRHIELVIPVIDKALKDASVAIGDIGDIDAIGVTYGPGLVGALLVGLCAGKGIASALGKPLVGVHHIEGHICALFLTHRHLEPPFICLVVSGGHSSIIVVRDYTKFEQLGQTRDDAAGEAFDKVARYLGLGYPGGPAIDRIAAQGDPGAVNFPRVRFENGSLDFSFSGLKTSVINYVNTLRQKADTDITPADVADIAASFQQAAVDVLVTNTLQAAKSIGFKKVAIAGGVAANSALRAKMTAEAGRNQMDVYIPEPVLCTDNAAMTASAAYFRYEKGMISGLDINAVPNISL